MKLEAIKLMLKLVILPLMLCVNLTLCLLLYREG